MTTGIIVGLVLGLVGYDVIKVVRRRRRRVRVERQMAYYYARLLAHLEQSNRSE